MWATEVDRRKLLLGAILAAAPGLVLSQRPVTEAEVDQARRTQPRITEEDLQRASERHGVPSEEALRQISVPGAPRIDRLPRPATAAPADLGSLARGLDADASSKLAVLTSQGPSLFVLVSFAMPEASLTRLAEQAARAKATLVLRGLIDGSMSRTAAQVQRLVTGRKLAVQIDPQKFDRYAVARTPAFVLVREQPSAQGCTGSTCSSPDAYAAVSGDVSLDYALEHMRRSAPRFASDASVFLRRLRR